VIIHQTIQKLKLEETCILTNCDDLNSLSTYFCEERIGEIRSAGMNWSGSCSIGPLTIVCFLNAAVTFGFRTNFVIHVAFEIF